MADFRKIFYALALVSLLAGLSAPAYAQGALSCDASAVTPPLIRTEGHTELVGEVLIECTGGVSTAPGNAVPRVNIRIRLTTNITSKLLDVSSQPGSEFNEALLIIDEPNSGRYAPNNMAPGQTGERPLLACGQTGAPDNSVSGFNVCDIIAPNHPSRTYDGLANGWWTTTDNASNLCDGAGGRPAAGTFGCGRPNVFQGHYVASLPNVVEWSGVPFDPPGAAEYNSGLAFGSPARRPWVRTLRFVNLRTDANAFFVAGNNSTIPILADIIFSGNTQAGIDDPRNMIVAYAASGLNAPSVSGTTSFIQCIEKELASLQGIRNNARNFTNSSPPLPSMFIRFGEGFDEAWKTEGWAEIQINSNTGRYTDYDEGFQVPSTFVRQNVPGAIYHTSSGFAAPIGSFPAADPSPLNPPSGIGNQPAPFAGQFIDNSTGITSAGVASNGTRLQVLFNDIPSGVTLYTPEVVYLTRKGTNVVTGIAILNRATDPKNGAFVAPSSPNAVDWVAVGSNRLMVYEMFYVDPFSEEELTVPIGLSTNINLLPQSIPSPTTVQGGFAPSHTSGAGVPLLASNSKGQIPRFFENLSGGQTLFTLDKCNCNLLFPFISNASGFDTGIAIANTSLSPVDSAYVQTLPQSGPVQFWYFQGGAMVRTECTNTASAGTCPGTTFVPSGGVMTFTVARGSNTWGLNGGPANFTGYLIAKAGFQYCHGFAYFSDLDRAVIPGIYGTSVGYLALVMDAENDDGRLPRTNNSVWDALDQ